MMNLKAGVEACLLKKCDETEHDCVVLVHELPSPTATAGGTMLELRGFDGEITDSSVS